MDAKSWYVLCMGINLCIYLVIFVKKEGIQYIGVVIVVVVVVRVYCMQPSGVAELSVVLVEFLEWKKKFCWKSFSLKLKIPHYV